MQGLLQIFLGDADIAGPVEAFTASDGFSLSLQRFPQPWGIPATWFGKDLHQLAAPQKGAGGEVLGWVHGFHGVEGAWRHSEKSWRI